MKYMEMLKTLGMTLLFFLSTNAFASEVVEDITSSAKVYQSSTFKNNELQFGAQNATDNLKTSDGLFNGSVYQNAVSVTAFESSPWLELELKYPATVESIEVWRRTDCCTNRLKGAYVFFSETPFEGRSFSQILNDENVNAQTIGDFSAVRKVFILGEKTKFIRIQHPPSSEHKTIEVAEIRVFGREKLLTKESKSTSSSVFKNNITDSGPENAHDGQFLSNGSANGSWYGDTVAITQLEHNPYIEFDLFNYSNIRTVNIWNRTDCCSNRLRDFYIFVSKKPFFDQSFDDLKDNAQVWSKYIEGPVGQNVLSEMDVDGRYVRIQLAHEGILQIAEVEIEGKVLAQGTFADTLSYVDIAISEPSYHVWGVSSIFDEDGKVHAFVCRTDAVVRFDQGWRTNAQVIHYVANSPEEEFVYSDVAADGTFVAGDWNYRAACNPEIKKVDGVYTLFYIANNGGEFVQNMGMKTSDSLYGPWVDQGESGRILTASTDPNNWTYGSKTIVNSAFLKVSNPNDDKPYHLYFKSGYKDPVTGKSYATYGLAESNKLTGPYTIRKDTIADGGATVEDGYVFELDGKIYLLTTDNHGIIQSGAGLLWVSTDGGNKFNVKEKGFKRPVEYIPPSLVAQYTPKVHYGSWKFERPQPLMKDGVPQYMIMPSGVSFEGSDTTSAYLLKVDQTLFSLWREYQN